VHHASRPSAIRSIALLALALTLAGCASTGTPSSASSASRAGTSASATAAPSTPALSGAITVFAAASLTDVLTTLAHQFEAAHPGTTITLSFGSSSTLATQITQAAPADVFASASTATMQTVVDAGAATGSVTFARNVLAIAVPPDNPGRVAALADLASSDVTVALCQPEVPCGVSAAAVLAKAGVTVRPVTLEADVKATLTKVELDEVDAGLVYATDVRAAGAKVRGIEIPAEVNSATSYPIAALTASKEPALATAFVDYVLSADGASVLTAAGFLEP